MNLRWTQFSLKLLFLITLAVSAYLAGRVPSAERLQIAEAQLAASIQQKLEQDHLIDFWEAVALEARPDLFNTVVNAEMVRDHRRGIGGTYKFVSLDNGFIRPRHLRWNIRFAGEQADYAEQLRRLGIAVIAVWDSPRRIQVIPNPKPQANLPEWGHALLLSGSYLDYRLAEREKAEPKLVMQSIPRLLEDRFAWYESESLKEFDEGLEQVYQTTFELRQCEDELCVMVVGHELKSQ